MGVLFSDPDQYVNCGNAADINDLAAATYMGWVRLHGWGTSGVHGRIYSKSTVSGSARTMFYVEPTGRLGFQRGRDTTDQTLVSNNAAIALDTWYHVSVVSGSAVAKLFINGVETSYSTQTIGSGSFLADSSYYGLLGNRVDLLRELPFRIEDFRIYDRALSDAEIATIWASRGHDNVLTGLARRYPLNERHDGAPAQAGAYFKSSAKAAIESTFVTVPVPACSDGDLLVAAIAAGGDIYGSPPNITTPSGWTLIGYSDCPSTTTTPSLWLFRRQASSEPGSYNFIMNQTCPVIGCICCYDGAIFSTTHSYFSASNGTTQYPSAPSVSPVAASLVLRVMVADSGSNSGNLPVPQGDVYASTLVGREATEWKTGTYGLVVLAFADELKPAGAVGTAGFTLGVSDQWATATVTFSGGAGAVEPKALRDVAPNKIDAVAHQHVVHTEGILSLRRRV
jgi:hypothetical protein